MQASTSIESMYRGFSRARCCSISFVSTCTMTVGGAFTTNPFACSKAMLSAVLSRIQGSGSSSGSGSGSNDDSWKAPSSAVGLLLPSRLCTLYFVRMRVRISSSLPCEKLNAVRLSFLRIVPSLSW